jgi:hypothetical protein
MEPYLELSLSTFFDVVKPVLHKHGESYASQEEQFNSDGKKRHASASGDKAVGEMAGIAAMIKIAGAMLIGLSEHLADVCYNAVKIIEKSGADMKEQAQARKVVMRMFGLAE